MSGCDILSDEGGKINTARHKICSSSGEQRPATCLMVQRVPLCLEAFERFARLHVLGVSFSDLHRNRRPVLDDRLLSLAKVLLEGRHLHLDGLTL